MGHEAPATEPLLSADRRDSGPSVYFQPVVARSRTYCTAVDPVAHDCITLVFVRCGTAVLLSEFGEKPVAPGDAVVIGASVLCGCEPDGPFTVTMLHLDRDYVADQVFWQNAGALTDRLQAHDLLEAPYIEPAQILRLGERRVGALSPWLDELVDLSIDNAGPRSFYRMQSLLFGVLHVIVPYIETTAVRRTRTQRAAATPALPRHRAFRPVRREARQAVELMEADVARRWTLEVLSEMVHLSPSRLSALFVEAYGKTPLAYLNMRRAEEMARLLRETSMKIEVAAREVGWRSHSHASSIFKQYLGVSPSRYRTLANERGQRYRVESLPRSS